MQDQSQWPGLWAVSPTSKPPRPCLTPLAHRERPPDPQRLTVEYLLPMSPAGQCCWRVRASNFPTLPQAAASRHLSHVYVKDAGRVLEWMNAVRRETI
jgi:hypothetical protein